MMALAFHYFQLILKIDDELCKKDYNKLIVYDRNTKSSGKSHTNADIQRAGLHGRSSACWTEKIQL